MKEEEIEEGSVRLVGIGSGTDSRWVDGSEVDSESPPWTVLEDEEDIRGGGGGGYRSVRRRLVKRPKRVDSFDVEAMEIAGAHAHHNKVQKYFSFFQISSHLCTHTRIYICRLSF